MGLNEEDIGKLEAAAVLRKQRLLSFKKKKSGIEDDDDSSMEEQELPAPKMLFRNYQPESKELEESKCPRVEPAKLEDLVKEQLEFGESYKPVSEVEMNSLAPKKITFDLRRGIQSHLDRLEQQTDKAIAELIRERLKEGRQQDFLIAVNAGARAREAQSYDSDDD